MLVGTGELRLPNRGERGDPPARLVGLLALVVALGVCTGIAAVGVTVSDPARVSASDSAAVGAAPGSGPATPGAAATTTADTPRAPITASGALAIIADDVRLPSESDLAWSGTNYDVALCAGARPSYPALQTVNDVRVVNTLTDEPRRTQLIAVAADENQARQLVQELVQPFRSCRVQGQEAATTSTHEIVGDQWQGGGSYSASVTDPGSRDPQVGYLVVGRAGRAVVAQTIVGRALPIGPGGAPDPGLDAGQQAFLDAMSEQVCRYRAQGCYIPPPPPYQPPDGSVLLPDGTWQVPDGSVVGPDGTVLIPAPVSADPPADQPAVPPAEPPPAEPSPVFTG